MLVGCVRIGGVGIGIGVGGFVELVGRGVGGVVEGGVVGEVVGVYVEDYRGIFFQLFAVGFGVFPFVEIFFNHLFEIGGLLFQVVEQQGVGVAAVQSRMLPQSVRFSSCAKPRLQLWGLKRPGVLM